MADVVRLPLPSAQLAFATPKGPTFREIAADWRSVTALLLPSGNVVRLTSGPPPNATSEKKLEDEGINAILAQSTDAKKKKKANKKKKKAGGGDGGDGDGETKEGGE